jgi:HlyD family secretion protein
MAASSTRTKRWLFWGGAAVAAAAAGIWTLRPQPVPVDIGLVARQPLRVTIDHEGQTRARHRYRISAPVSGRLLRIALEPGDRVERGRSVLATLLPTPAPLLDARARATAEARVRAAQAAVGQARAALGQAQTQAEYAEQERERLIKLYVAAAVSERERDAAVAEARARQQAVAVAASAVETAGQELEVARSTLVAATTAGQTGGEPVTLRAPIDGVVLRRFHESEAVVNAGEPVLELADLSALEVAADFLSTDAVSIQPGMTALIDRWGGGEPLAGTVRRVEPSAFTKISALGVEEQRVWVVVDFDEPREAWDALGDGYRVEVRVVLWESPDALVVPASALFRAGEAWHVYVIGPDDVIREQAVEIGRQTGLEADVRAGVEAGDRVVLHPSDRVAAGLTAVAR